MTDIELASISIDSAIAKLRAIESVRELTDKEERLLVSLLKCKNEDVVNSSSTYSSQLFQEITLESEELMNRKDVPVSGRLSEQSIIEGLMLYRCRRGECDLDAPCGRHRQVVKIAARLQEQYKRRTASRAVV